MLQELATATLGSFLALFPITNPVGAVPIFSSLTADLSSHQQQLQARRTAVNSVWILMVFLLMGQAILSFFGITLGVLRVAGGLLVAQTAWEVISAQHRLSDPESAEAMDRTDVSLIPMAIPIVSGPGAIGVVIGLTSGFDWIQIVGSSLGIGLVGITLYLCLRSSRLLLGILGQNGIGAFNRVLGLFILAISVQMIADGGFALVQAQLESLLQELNVNSLT